MEDISLLRSFGKGQRSLIQQIALEHRRRYGYRRITAELHRRGVQVNRKKVARMMRDDNLLAIQPKVRGHDEFET
jgi:transposase InsO family protein